MDVVTYHSGSVLSLSIWRSGVVLLGSILCLRNVEHIDSLLDLSLRVLRVVCNTTVTDDNSGRDSTNLVTPSVWSVYELFVGAWGG